MGVLRKIVSSVIPGKYKSSIIQLFQSAFYSGLVKVSGVTEEAYFGLMRRPKEHHIP